MMITVHQPMLTENVDISNISCWQEQHYRAECWREQHSGARVL